MSIILSPKPVGTIYDATTQAAAGVSVTAQGARVVSIGGIQSSQNALIVQVRLDDTGDWLNYKTVDPSVANALVELTTNYNRVRVTGLIAGNVVMAQG